jgi:hypothetical protein
MALVSYLNLNVKQVKASAKENILTYGLYNDLRISYLRETMQVLKIVEVNKKVEINCIRSPNTIKIKSGTICEFDEQTFSKIKQ